MRAIYHRFIGMFDWQRGWLMVYLIGNEAAKAKDHRQAAKLLIHLWAKTNGVHGYPGADPGFFFWGGAFVSCSTSTPINHRFFFLQNTSCIRKPQVISGGCAPPCTLPLDPPSYLTPNSWFLTKSANTRIRLTYRLIDFIYFLAGS